MFILLFDIDASISCRCHQYYLTLLCVCMLLMICCGFAETTSLKIDASTPKSIPVILPSPVKQQQPKPSSVIYIPSLDDVNEVNNIHASEHDIRFEDFFWNGSGDEPLTLSLKSNARLTAVNGFVGRETFIKTATVIATVYIDDSNENGKYPDCDSDKCDTDSNEIPDDYVPVNKHFWLVTRVHGYLSDEDIPLLQQKLADIYRIAFTRQQSLHLGLLNVTVESSDEPMAGGSGGVGNGSLPNDITPIIENKQSTNSSMSINSTSVLKYEYAIPGPTVSSIQSNVSMMQATVSMQNQTLSDENVNATTNATIDTALTMHANQSESHRHKRSMSSILQPPIAPIPSNIQQHNSTEILLQSTNEKSRSNFSNITNSNVKSSDLQNVPIDNGGKTKTKNSTPRGTKKNRNDAIIGHISVQIHNISVISNADRDYLNNLEKEWTNPVQGNNFSSDSVTSADNQTEIIYTVFVNGIPVLANIAANDMKLMREDEVSKILGKSIFTKAEPYLKEPQATPLIPSSTTTSNQNKPILAMIFQNPYILAFIGALFLLIILLLMILMLIIGSKKQRITTTTSTTKKKGVSKAAQTAQQSFLPPVPVSVPSHVQPQSNVNTTIGHMPNIDESHQFRSNMTSEILSRHSNAIRQKKQVGTQITSLHDTVDGYACERDHSFIIIPTPLKRRHHKKIGTPTIYFPEPPSSEPSSLSHSQTQSSSSSSSLSDTSSIYYIKKHKNRRSHHLYAKQPKRVASLNHREYATITKKQIERAQKKSKHKRKYLKSGNGNRIGAFEETVQVHSSRSSSTGDKTKQQQKQPANGSDDTFEMSTGKDSNVYEHIEAFNPMIGKMKNLNNQIMSMEQMNNDETKMTISNETEKSVPSKAHRDDKRQNKKDMVSHTKMEMNAFSTRSAYDRSKKATDNKHVKESNRASEDSRKIQIDRLSNQFSNDEVHTANDDLSIGSFLSMASIQSFPKCNVPEPLSRLLEPANDTQLDQYDEIEATEAATIASKLPRIVDAKAKKPPPRLQQKYHQQQCEPTTATATTTDKKNDEIVYLTRTRSDGADPGVIGPIAWQYHKKRLEEQERTKLHCDPLCTQHRYEDLLEGAISLYSIETTEYHTIETITKEEFPEILIGKDMRGKSADMYNLNTTSVTKSSPKPYRPFTAMMAPKTAPEQPLITSKGAWTGSTVIRPTSGDKSADNPSPNHLKPPQNKPE